MTEVLGSRVEEVERAREVVAAYDSALADGTGVVVDGRMVDLPVVLPARSVLDSAREGRNGCGEDVI